MLEAGAERYRQSRESGLVRAILAVSNTCRRSGRINNDCRAGATPRDGAPKKRGDRSIRDRKFEPSKSDLWVSSALPSLAHDAGPLELCLQQRDRAKLGVALEDHPDSRRLSFADDQLPFPDVVCESAWNKGSDAIADLGIAQV